MNKRILIVDDSSLSRRTLRGMLEGAGYAVEEASDGAQALERYFLNPHDIVLLDPGTLPRTSSGKLRRQAALQQYRTATLRAPRRATPLHLAHEMVRSHLALKRARPT